MNQVSNYASSQKYKTSLTVYWLVYFNTLWKIKNISKILLVVTENIRESKILEILISDILDSYQLITEKVG